MESKLQRHFKTLSLGARVLLTAGVVSLSTGGFGFWLSQSSFWKGMCTALLLLGIVQLTKGAISYIASSRQMLALNALLRDFPSQFVRVENARLSASLQEINERRKRELFLIILGILTMLGATLYDTGNFALGVGVGMSIQATVLFIHSLISQWHVDGFRSEVNRFAGHLEHKRSDFA